MITRDHSNRPYLLVSLARETADLALSFPPAVSASTVVTALVDSVGVLCACEEVDSGSVEVIVGVALTMGVGVALGSMEVVARVGVTLGSVKVVAGVGVTLESVEVMVGVALGSVKVVTGMGVLLEASMAW